MVKNGPGTLRLTGTNTYLGTTAVNAGVLDIAPTGSLSNSSPLTLNGGTLRYNSTTNYTGTLTLTSGTIGGTNMLGSLGNRTIGTGLRLSPGNSPGTASTDSQTWAGGGTYLCAGLDVLVGRHDWLRAVAIAPSLSPATSGVLRYGQGGPVCVDQAFSSRSWAC